MQKVSVIVPVYRVEKYLLKCIDSILAQTFRDFELLLVDDGSPDRCGEFCDAYALADNRVRVIHKENGGLSSARNAGIDAASGAYILFVDSDDYLPPNHVGVLYDLLIKYDADIAAGSVQYVPGPNICHSETLFTRSQCIEAILYRNGITDCACSKLYKASLFQDTLFTEGILSEDFDLFYRLFSKADSVAVTDQTTYFYVQRSGSLLSQKFNRQFLNRMDICERLISDVSRDCPRILPAAYSRAVDENVWLYGITPRAYAGERARMRRTVRAYAPGVLRDPKATAKVKRKALVFLLCPALWSLRMRLKTVLIRAAERIRKGGMA